MKNFIITLLTFLAWGQAFACPLCAGSQDGNDQYLVYVLMAFVVLIYIPFYFVYRTIIKNRNPNSPSDSETK